MNGSQANTYPVRGASVAMRPLPSGSRVGSMVRDGRVQIEGTTSGNLPIESGLAGWAGAVNGGGRPGLGGMARKRSSRAALRSAQACIGSRSAHCTSSSSGPCWRLSPIPGGARQGGTSAQATPTTSRAPRIQTLFTRLNPDYVEPQFGQKHDRSPTDGDHTMPDRATRIAAFRATAAFLVLLFAGQMPAQ